MEEIDVQYPVIDLFAGPGGLGEGFSGYHMGCKPSFNLVAAFEENKHAHQTLVLRYFFNSFKPEEAPDDYYDYLDGVISKEELISKYSDNWQRAEIAIIRKSLSKANRSGIRKLITNRLAGKRKWALIGGPPCQAYSLVGRARRVRNTSCSLEKDERYFLYQEYLDVIVNHRPPVFVMENVKGMLSARANNQSVLDKIRDNFSKPLKFIGKGSGELTYRLFSLTRPWETDESYDSREFVVRAEEFGVPQARHRVFILGIRSDLNIRPNCLRKFPQPTPTVEEIIGNMPKIRSSVSRVKDSVEIWKNSVASADIQGWLPEGCESAEAIRLEIQNVLKAINESNLDTSSTVKDIPTAMHKWYYDSRLKGTVSHEARSHMESDLHRYLFAASYAAVRCTSPKLANFPEMLLPAHKNAEQGRGGNLFSDRFRVQLKSRVSSTITSHISKDGHYYIHYDPVQCRSLSVREAARLQTFPDNYHFEGPRTEQYHQLGNAVPPYLAFQIAKIVKGVLDRMPDND